MTRYYRNKSGTIVHWNHCERMGKTALPWHWAEGKSERIIALRMFEHKIRPCKTCNPPLWPALAHIRLVVNGD